MNTADEWAKALDGRNHGSGMHDPETNHRLTVVIEKRLANNANTIRAAQLEAWDAAVTAVIEAWEDCDTEGDTARERYAAEREAMSALKGRCP